MPKFFLIFVENVTQLALNIIKLIPLELQQDTPICKSLATQKKTTQAYFESKLFLGDVAGSWEGWVKSTEFPLDCITSCG